VEEEAEEGEGEGGMDSLPSPTSDPLSSSSPMAVTDRLKEKLFSSAPPSSPDVEKKTRPSETKSREKEKEEKEEKEKRRKGKGLSRESSEEKDKRRKGYSREVSSTFINLDKASRGKGSREKDKEKEWMDSPTSDTAEDGSSSTSGKGKSTGGSGGRRGGGGRRSAREVVDLPKFGKVFLIYFSDI